MPELVLYGLRLLAKQFLGAILDMEVDQSARTAGPDYVVLAVSANGQMIVLASEYLGEISGFGRPAGYLVIAAPDIKTIWRPAAPSPGWPDRD